MIVKEIFLQIMDFLKINEQILLKRVNVECKEYIDDKFKNYGFLIRQFTNPPSAFFTEFNRANKYINEELYE